MTAKKKTITSREPISPDATMIRAGMAIMTIILTKSCMVLMGLSDWESTRARTRIMESLANSEG